MDREIAGSQRQVDPDELPSVKGQSVPPDDDEMERVEYLGELAQLSEGTVVRDARGVVWVRNEKTDDDAGQYIHWKGTNGALAHSAALMSPVDVLWVSDRPIGDRPDQPVSVASESDGIKIQFCIPFGGSFIRRMIDIPRAGEWIVDNEEIEHEIESVRWERDGQPVIWLRAHRT